MANPPGAPGPAPGSGQSSNSGLPYLNSPFGDTTYTKVFVGGLAWETQSETLRRHFEQYGDILEAVVITDKNTRRSKGYGFVTFRDPESAARACDDPSPTIDGRRANCNLASLGRLRHPPTQARPGTAGPYIGGVPVPHGAYVGSSGYQHLLPYGYNQQGFPYLPYGYAAYGSEYASYPQMYNPYTGQQFVQVYGVPAPVNSMAYPLGQPGQPGQPLPGGPGYMAFQNYQVPNQTLLQFGTPNVNGVAPGGLSSVQPSFPPGAAQFPQSHLVVTVPSPQFSQGNGSDQTAG